MVVVVLKKISQELSKTKMSEQNIINKEMQSGGEC